MKRKILAIFSKSLRNGVLSLERYFFKKQYLGFIERGMRKENVEYVVL